MNMTLISVNVGYPVEIEHDDAWLRTSLFKRPLTGPVVVRRLHLDVDGQADLVPHGGEHKATGGASAEARSTFCRPRGNFR